jgi:hypothetical protein
MDPLEELEKRQHALLRQLTRLQVNRSFYHSSVRSSIIIYHFPPPPSSHSSVVGHGMVCMMM